MVVRIIRQALCDACLQDPGDEQEATWSHPVQLWDSKWDADLCDYHAEQLVQPLVAALSGAAPPDPEAAGQEDESARCPACDKSYTTHKSMRWHYKQHHPDAPALPRKPGSGRSPSAAEVARPATLCPVCRRVCLGSQGLAAHMRFAHPAEWEAHKAERDFG